MIQPKRVLITGGSSGLGLAFAHRLAARGAQLVLVARDRKRLADAKSSLAQALPGVRVDTLAADVADAGAMRQVAETVAIGGDIDWLINSAGILRTGYVDTSPDRDFCEQMEINYLGTVNSVRAFLPQLRRTRGRIVNISSLSGVMGVFGYAGYCASKHAVQGFTEVLRLELKPAGIHVHAVCPGEFESPMLDAIQDGRSPENKAQATMVPAISPERVVDDALRGMESNTFVIVPGRLARATHFSNQHFPAVSRWVSDQRIGRVYVGPNLNGKNNGGRDS